MKKLFVLFIALACICCNRKNNAEADATEEALGTIENPSERVPEAQEPKPFEQSLSDREDTIAAIRKRVEYINTAKLEKKHYEFMCDEKMMADYFYDNGELVKVAVDFGTVGDVYAKEGYYYDKGKLVFNYEFTEGGPACEGCIKTHEYRTYIQNGKAIKYMKDKNVETCRTCEFGAKSRQYKVLKAKTQDEVKAALCR